MSLSPRERVLAAIDRRPVDRIPTDYWGTPETTEMLLRHFGLADEAELWPRLHVDKIARAVPAYVGPPLVDDGDLKVDYWGVHRRPVSYAAGVYCEMSFHPLSQFETVDQIEAGYTWPSADWFDFTDIADQCARFPEYAIMGGYMSPFYMYNNNRGLSESLMDLVANPQIADYCLGKISDFYYEYHSRLFEAGRGQIHVTQVTDDLGCQTGLLISRAAFLRYLDRHFQRLIGLAKDFGIRVMHHDDGAMAELIPDLVRLGIDVLNPVQWRLPGMDPTRLKATYGDMLSFHGGVDNQWVMPFGTPKDVEAEVLHLLGTLGRGGTGYVLAPCHNLQSITPVENIVRMYEVAYHEGRV